MRTLSTFGLLSALCLPLLLSPLACAGKPKAAPAPAPAAAPTPVTKAEPDQPREAPWASSGITDWKTPPESGPEPKFRAPAPSTFKLRSGLSVVVYPRHVLPLVSVRLIVRGAGYAADPKKQPGLAAFTADLLDEGAGRRSALEIAKETERLGASLETGVTADYGYLSMQTLARTFDPALALFLSVATHPTFAKAEATRLRKEWIDTLKTRQDRSREVASLVFNQTLYGPKTPYGHPADGFANTAKQLQGKAAKKFHHSHWRPEAMVLVVVGDVDIVALQKTIKKRLARFKPRGKKVKRVAPRAPAARKAARLTLIDRPEAPQSELVAGLVALSRDDPRFVPFEVVTTLLGGGFTSRLNHRLREELGYTYGIRAQQVERDAEGPFLITSALHTPKTVDAVKEILHLVDDVAKTPVAKDELEKVKQNLIRALPTRFETNAQVADTFADLAARGLPLTWYDDYAAAIDAVDAPTVQKLAAKLIPEGQLRFTIVGDAKAITPGLETLLGAPLHVDANGSRLPTP